MPRALVSFTAAIALVVVAVTVPAIASATGASATMRVTPATQTHTVGETFDVIISIDAPANTGAFEFTLKFDAAVVDVVSAQDAGFLSSTGRFASCFTLDFDNVLHFGCSTSGPSPAGPSGPGSLARVTLRALKPGISQLSIRDRSLTNENGDPLPVTDVDGSVTVLAGVQPPTATNTTFAPIPTATTPPSATPAAPPTPTATAASFAPPAPTSTTAQSAPAGTITHTPGPAGETASSPTHAAAGATATPAASTLPLSSSPQTTDGHATAEGAAAADGEPRGRGDERPGGGQAGVLGATRRPGIKLPDTGSAGAARDPCAP